MGPQHLRPVQLFWLLGTISTLPHMSCGAGCSKTQKGTSRGVVGFKGCSPSLSYPAQVSYLVSPPGVSIASYSRVCRSYLCNNLTNLEPFVKLKASAPKSASHSCPTRVGEHLKECLPNFVNTSSCPLTASKPGFLNTTFLLMSCAREYKQLLADFHHIGSIKVTEVLNILEKSQIVGAGSSRQGPA
uniref:LY6/PLAUR domain containing 4 n=1 Tax=Aotus nancymaae TaxID=37293 RepID=A0A2K5DQU4_AOTNA